MKDHSLRFLLNPCIVLPWFEVWSWCQIFCLQFPSNFLSCTKSWVCYFSDWSLLPIFPRHHLMLFFLLITQPWVNFLRSMVWHVPFTCMKNFTIWFRHSIGCFLPIKIFVLIPNTFLSQSSIESAPATNFRLALLSTLWSAVEFITYDEFHWLPFWQMENYSWLLHHTFSTDSTYWCFCTLPTSLHKSD